MPDSNSEEFKRLLRPVKPIAPLNLPAPSGYRQSTPAILGPPPTGIKNRRFERKRVLFVFAVAVALHVALALAWWLTPPLRLKAGYAPERWVQVLAVPRRAAAPPPAPTLITIEPPKKSSAETVPTESR